MRVAVIASMKRGLEHFVYRELTSLEKRGMSISLYPTKQATGLYNPKPEWDVHRWRPLGVLAAQPRSFVRAPGIYLRLLREAAAMGAIVDFMLAWYFARTMADASVIYATFGDHKLFVGYFCKRIIGLPLVVTIHAYELYQNPNPRLFRRALAACDQIITVTEYNREILAERYGVDPGRVAVVRITVDTERYRPADKFVILIVAYFVEKKGHDVLFEAVRRLGRDDIEVWVVGDVGPGEPVVDARALAARRGVESQVVFFGALGGQALEALYRACDVFCLPSHHDSLGGAEGFPTAIAEAMAFGKPVISTRHVEIPRILDEILVDEKDPEGLALAIDYLYRSPEERARLGAKNRRIAEERFSLRNTDQTAAILSGLAAGAGRDTLTLAASAATAGTGQQYAVPGTREHGE
ncbi:glycosyltransferase family 4 protein [Sphaerobacter thermophilus]|nr:glycosyltransferase family 4 protein [Sphaerobacter thermophilus]